MSNGCTFKEFVNKKCGDLLYSAAKKYAEDHWESLDLYTRNVNTIGSVNFEDATITQVYVRDLPGMKIAFEVVMQLDLYVREGDYHYDEYDLCNPKIVIPCQGDISNGLCDWKIDGEIQPYDYSIIKEKALSDDLVPIISKDDLETVATEILSEYYPEALRVTPYGERAISVKPTTLAKRLGLRIFPHQIDESNSVFGQLYFADCKASLYEFTSHKTVDIPITAKTIVVDPHASFMYGIGSLNNTIVHECVHWIKHRKAFELERLYNNGFTSITCESAGGIDSPFQEKSARFMEWQANALTPRIQMPKKPFLAKANDYILLYKNTTGAKYTHEIMENVIDALALDYDVSRQSAKIRLIELGVEEALGTFTYLDDHYVRAHTFRKGAIKTNQTFSISAQDAAIERFKNPLLRKLTENGDYLFVENHFVYNTPEYIQRNADGTLALTDYALANMDECCLIFDMKVSSGANAVYSSFCYLNREKTNVTFELTFHNGYENIPPEGQVAYRKKKQEEELAIRKQMTDDPQQCMELLLDWREMNYTELASEIDMDEKTISRTVNGRTEPKLKTVLLICFGLQLPPVISSKLLDVFQCKLNPLNSEHLWIQEALQTKYMEPVFVIRKYLEQYGVTL